MLPALILAPPAQGKVYSAVGDVYTVLADGSQTSNAYTLLSARVPPGGGPPPHRHSREEESFYILEGTMTFQVEGKSHVAKPGAFVQVPRGTFHAFKNESDAPVRMLILCAPAGFENFLAAFGTELPSADAEPLPPTQAEIERLIATAPQFGIELAPPPHA